VSATPPSTLGPEPVAPEVPRVQRYRLSRRDRLLRAVAPRDRLRQVALLAVVLGVWEYVGRRSERFTFAPPSSVVSAAGDMIGSGQLQRALASSVGALLLGFAAAGIVGIGLGFAMGAWRSLGRTLDPFVSAVYVVPVASLVPVIVAWVGLGMDARVLVIFLFAVFEPLLSVYAGVKQIDPALYDAARTFGAGRADLMRRVMLPAALPFVFVGLRMGAARAVKGMVLAEMLFAVTGLGGIIIKSAQDFRIDRVLVAVVTVALIGVLLSAVVAAAERYALRWRR
jgi:ABC-type nitrate/sulfonate/bicarbonate transport system permease component